MESCTVTFFKSRQSNIISPCSSRWLDAHPQTEAVWDRCLPHCEGCSRIPCVAQGGWGKAPWWDPCPHVLVLIVVPGINTIYCLHTGSFMDTTDWLILLTEITDSTLVTHKPNAGPKLDSYHYNIFHEIH
jgi:hypothetical protein